MHQGYIVVFRVVLNMSEQSLEFNWMPGISTTRAVAEDTSLLHYSAPGPVLYTGNRQQKLNWMSYLEKDEPSLHQ